MMKKASIILGLGIISFAAIIAGTTPKFDYQLVNNPAPLEAEKKGTKTEGTNTSAVLIQPDAFLDYGIDLNTPFSSSGSSAPKLVQPDAFEDYGIDLSQSNTLQNEYNAGKKSPYTLPYFEAFNKNNRLKSFGFKATALEMYNQATGVLQITSHIIENVTDIVRNTQQITENEEVIAPDFLKLFFNFV